MENKVQVISSSEGRELDQEWIELILMALKKGYTKEEVRKFLHETGQSNQSD